MAQPALESASLASEQPQIFIPNVILITGGAGFIGSHVARRLDAQYSYRLVVVDNLDTCSNVKNIQGLSDHVCFVQGDICDEAFLLELMQKEHVDTILHFAAQTHVDRSFGDSFAFTRNNVVGTHVLLESARKLKPQIRRIVHVSTDEVYGETTEGSPRHFTEFTSPLNPTNPYSASKAAAEMIVKAYQKSFNLPIIVTRGNNVYGSCQHPEKVVPKFIMRAMMEKPLPVHGSGEQLRGYVHVSDVAKAFDLLLHKGSLNHIYNISSIEEISILEVARSVCQLAGLDTSKFIEHVEDRLYQDRRYLVDNGNLVKLGWRAEISWAEGIERTYAWYQEHMDYWKNVEEALEAHYDDRPENSIGQFNN